jgi:hypothetical protein
MPKVLQDNHRIPIEKPVNRSDIPNSRKSDSDSQNQEEIINEEPKWKEQAAPVVDNVYPSRPSAQQPPAIDEKELPPLPKDEFKKQHVLQPTPPSLTVQTTQQSAVETKTSAIVASLEAIKSPNPYTNPKTISKEKNHYVISYTFGGGKITRLQLTGVDGGIVMDAQLKKWDEKWYFLFI